MTVRERLHAWIDGLSEAEASKLAMRHGLVNDALDVDDVANNDLPDDIALAITLWEALAEPVENDAQRAEFEDAIKRRPFFGSRDYPVLPD
ncbi:MAG: hypothetical protein AAF708_23470 [Deinococcota bacterium]